MDKCGLHDLAARGNNVGSLQSRQERRVHEVDRGIEVAHAVLPMIVHGDLDADRSVDHAQQRGR